MIHTSLSSTQCIFDEQKTALRKYGVAGYPQMDVEMTPVIEKLNKLPGIATTDCCASHPDQNNSRLYVAAVVTPDGLVNFSSVYEVFAKLLYGDVRLQRYRCQVRFSTRLRFTDPHTTEPTFVWSIQTLAKTNQDKAAMLELLEKAVDHVHGNHAAGSLQGPGEHQGSDN